MSETTSLRTRVSNKQILNILIELGNGGIGMFPGDIGGIDLRYLSAGQQESPRKQRFFHRTGRADFSHQATHDQTLFRGRHVADSLDDLPGNRHTRRGDLVQILQGGRCRAAAPGSACRG